MRLILVTLLCLAFYSYGQKNIEVVVLDAQTEQPVSFVKIGNEGQTPVLTDIDGRATLTVFPRESYHFSFYEYQDTLIKGSDLIEDPLVYLSPDLQILDEVIITPGINPAHRIIKNAMENRKENDPLRNDSFRYKAFSKFYLTGETDDIVIRDTITDTAELRMIELLEQQYIFLTETASIRTFSPPNYDKEVITSYKVSGLKNPMFATLANQLQSFSFYDNIFSISGKDYINPIAPGGLRRYLFVLEDTLFQGKDTTYTISFRPRMGKNFEGLKGFLFINTNGWALERVIASPYEQANLGKLKIIQEYKFTNDKKWFPHQLSTEIEFENMSLGRYNNAVARSNLYIKEVEFGVETKKGFNPIRLEVAPDAVDDTSGLRKARERDISEKEKKTYIVIDSISEDANLERTVEALNVLSTGKIPIGKISIPLHRVMDFNQQEGLRLGLGLETNSRLSDRFQIGGYAAYGLRDESWKWGGNLGVIFHKKKQIGLHLIYREDLFERGGTDFRKDDFNLTGESFYRNFYINRLDRERFASVSLSGLVTPNFRLRLIGNYRRINFTDDYAFIPLFTQNPTSTSFDVAETGFIINWNIRESLMMLGDRRVSLGSKFPQITLKAVKGWDDFFEGDYEYYRASLDIEQSFSIRGVGQLDLYSRSGISVGNTPISLQQILYGTGVSWNLIVPNTFETMQPAEFYSDLKTAFFMRMRFLPLKNQTTWTEPKFVIHSAAGVGTMNNRTDHINYPFKVPEEGYFESGLIVENLIKFGFNGFGIGAFYRYGPYAFDAWEDNFVYKLSLTFNL